MGLRQVRLWGALAFAGLAFAGLTLAACTQPRTQMLLVVETDMVVPDAIDEIQIEVESPLFERQFANALLRDTPPPRSLNLVHEGGPLGTFEARVRGLRGSAPVVEQTVEFAFVPDETRVLRIRLLDSCAGMTCSDAQTCDEGGCRERLRAEDELEEFDESIPLGDSGTPVEDAGQDDAGTPTDAAPPADAGDCTPSDEACNGEDDDCDGDVDEDFNLMTDGAHCGMCGVSCGGADCQGGECQVMCEAGTANCDDDPSDCETDTESDVDHCGGCGIECRGRNDECCEGSCERRCR